MNISGKKKGPSFFKLMEKIVGAENWGMKKDKSTIVHIWFAYQFRQRDRKILKRKWNIKGNPPWPYYKALLQTNARFRGNRRSSRKREKWRKRSKNPLIFLPFPPPSLGLFLLLHREKKKIGGFDGWMPNSFLFWETFVCFRFFSKGTFHLQLLYPIIPLGLISCYSIRNRIWHIYQTFLFCFLSTIIRQTEREVEASERRRLIYWRARALSFSLLLPTPHFPFLFPLSVSLFFHFLYLILLFLIPSFPLHVYGEGYERTYFCM